MKRELKKKFVPEPSSNPDIPDYSKYPVFVKKTEEARATLRKYGLPKEFTEQRKTKAPKSKKTSS
ncbi:MAG TPA: hypothetical protein VG890_00625 [Puia sp.]|nr:hypothetical protein [Puia sp.]